MLKNNQVVFHDKQIAYLIADWTRRDPAITALLAAHGRSGVPLYLYYAPGAAEPTVLPHALLEQARALHSASVA